MIIIRSFLYTLLMAISVVIFASTISFFSFFLNSAQLSTIANYWGRFNLYLLRTICNLKYEIQGWENLPKDQPFIIIAKHQSTWETMALRGLLPNKQSWILKKELINYPFFGRALLKTGQIAIDRSQGRKALKALIEQGVSALSKNKIVIIFPEGTRTRYGEDSKYHIGGALLAEKSQVPVLPIVHNAGKFWPKGFLIHPGTINLVIGKPISTIGLKAKKINELTKQWIEDRMKQF
ncbi:MAG: lysophospholipid acyltransferase family protein [Bacteroidota bacterium]